ncbi:preprotein translocase subunit YajC [Paenibacillus sp. S-38]|uniref:preprotein translocase subunit YajC n=1 Tax=Paenibacillus sp. S-38 TaxID=3416710 RepID=UPI003CEA2463
MSAEVQEHAERIDRLLKVDRQVVLAARIHGLILGVRNKELTIEDVIRFTNIDREQLLKMMESEGGSADATASGNCS